MTERAFSSADSIIPVRSVAEGEYIFRAGQPAHAFFIVGTGQVELLRRGETHGRLALLGPGDLCGEASAFESQARLCDARAVSSATVLEVTAEVFADLVRARPELAAALLSRTALHLLQARMACLAMAQPIARTAVARFVHVESGSQFPLPEGDPVVIGRADPRTSFKPDIELSSVDAHRSLSRRHAVITRSGADYRIAEAPRVANGTSLNGVRLRSGEAVPMNDGDEVSFGLIRTVFRTT